MLEVLAQIHQHFPHNHISPIFADKDAFDMNIHRLKDALHELIDACDDKELLDHFLQVLHLEKASNAQGFSKEFKSEMHAAFSAELGDMEDFESYGISDDPLDYPEFEGGMN